MVRRDVTQDADRPHYYSQYWIDVARGEEKTPGQAASAIAAPAEPDEDEASDDLLMDEITPRLERTERAEPKKPAAKPAEKKPETAGRPTLTSFADLANIANIDLLMKSSAELGDDVTPDIEAAAPPTPAADTATSFQYGAANEETPEAEAEASDADTFEFEDEDEDEEDGWGGSRRKPKQPKPKRRERRDY